MPRLDLILLPLIAGYIFAITFNLTKYYHLRLERQRLIYNSLVFAIIISVIAYLFDFFILKSNFSISFCNFKTESASFYRNKISLFIDELFHISNVKGLKHSILTFTISWPLAKILNLFFSRKFSFDYTISKWGNQLERIIWFSLTKKNEEDKLLMITTKSNKVYIGYVNKLSEPIGETYITILPNFSGYRSKDDLRVEITTKYTDVIEKYILEDRQDEIGEKLSIILPVSEILIVSKFDNEIFGQFNTDVSSNKSNSTLLQRFQNFFK